MSLHLTESLALSMALAQLDSVNVKVLCFTAGETYLYFVDKSLNQIIYKYLLSISYEPKIMLNALRALFHLIFTIIPLEKYLVPLLPSFYKWED